MADTELRADSIRVRFERGVPEPSDTEIFTFMKEKMGLSCEKLLSMYKERNETSIIIKFKNEQYMQNTLRDLPESLDFTYNRSPSTVVKLSAANTIVRYVRLFNLPPEVEDRDIAAVLNKFGKVTRLVREKYAEETGFPIWTSVRGVYLEFKDGVEIPAMLHIRGVRARVFYEGLVNKCFVCGNKDHLKADCPQKRSVNQRLQTSNQTSYSGIVKGDARWTKQQFAKENSKESEIGMTNLGTVLPIRQRCPTQVGASMGAEEDGAVGAENVEQTQTKPGSSTNTTIADGKHGVRVKAAGGNEPAATMTEFITVASKRGRKHVKEQYAEKSDSDQSTTEADNNVYAVVVPSGERVSEATDRCTRSKAKQLKLVDQSKASSSAMRETSVDPDATEHVANMMIDDLGL